MAGPKLPLMEYRWDDQGCLTHGCVSPSTLRFLCMSYRYESGELNRSTPSLLSPLSSLVTGLSSWRSIDGGIRVEEGPEVERAAGRQYLESLSHILVPWECSWETEGTNSPETGLKMRIIEPAPGHLGSEQWRETYIIRLAKRRLVPCTVQLTSFNAS